MRVRGEGGVRMRVWGEGESEGWGYGLECGVTVRLGVWMRVMCEGESVG